MADETQNRARFRLKYDKTQWILERGYHSKAAEEKGEDATRWTIDSYHSRIKNAFAYMLDRLIAEGYEPKGMAELKTRVDAAEAAVMEWGARLEENINAELDPLT
jgi:hypothetical protein